MTNDPAVNQQASGVLRADLGEAVGDFCRELIARLHLSLHAEVREQGRTVWVNLSGPDRPILLSNTAAVLNSVEYVVNKAFRTGKEEKIATIVFDSDHYRQYREAELKLLAQIASQKVIAQGRPLNLQPMTPRERRIVHLALASIEGVRSQSDGEGDHRSITIYPAD
ncbi:MAG: jag [Acidobacteria bacterium]|nr:jag [Acidobacteriota bacterium]